MLCLFLESSRSNRKPLKFQKMWLDYTDFDRIVNSVQNCSSDLFSIVIHVLANAFSNQNHFTIGNVFEKKERVDCEVKKD